MALGADVIKTFFFALNEWSNRLVLGKPFQISLMFASKAGAYPNEVPFRCSTLEKTHGLTQRH